MSKNIQSSKAISLWLALLCVLVAVIVAVGGITRLTGSGLSMVEWKPIIGSIPPLNDAQWKQTFSLYQQFPEYKHSGGMSLAEFKSIFFWEYLHRMLGRLIGVLFLVPFLFFYFRGYLDRHLSIKLMIAFCLLTAQGLMGWYMVQSGLVDVPHVSHYRLASHLFLAFIFFAWLFWLFLDLRSPTQHDMINPKRSDLLWMFANTITALVLIQVVFGAFVAGKHAGLGYNTFPRMDGQWVPDEIFRLEPLWKNFFENSATLQFIHRGIAYILTLAIFSFWLLLKKHAANRRQRLAGNILLLGCLLQVCLGVATLLYKVPLVLAVSHQLGALVLFAMAIVCSHATANPKQADQRKP